MAYAQAFGTASFALDTVCYAYTVTGKEYFLNISRQLPSLMLRDLVASFFDGFVQCLTGSLQKPGRIVTTAGSGERSITHTKTHHTFRHLSSWDGKLTFAEVRQDLKTAI